MIFSYYFKNIIISVVAFLLFCANWIIPVNIMKISVKPAVFESGGDYYTIVWETSLKGSGCVKYTYNGEEKVVWDASGGIIASDDTIHTVKVPKEELKGNTYKVCSQFVAFKFGYQCLKGKECESEEITFRGEEKQDDIKALCVSDIHEMEKTMHKTLSFLKEEPDILFMIGDITSEMRTKDQFTKFLLKDAADISKGEIPVVYTRGNHETRGEFAAQMYDYLSTVTGEFFYTFKFGALSAVVLDSGEDKEDSHIEYSGLIDFENYRNKQFEWMNTLKKKDLDGKYKIVLCHEPKVENHFGKDWTEPMKNLDMDLIVGGHWHEVDFIDGELPALVDGGNLGDNHWAVTVLTLKDGIIAIETIDNEGNVLLEKTIKA